jgi:hypothetical protein
VPSEDISINLGRKKVKVIRFAAVLFFLFYAFGIVRFGNAVMNSHRPILPFAIFSLLALAIAASISFGFWKLKPWALRIPFFFSNYIIWGAGFAFLLNGCLSNPFAVTNLVGPIVIILMAICIRLFFEGVPLPEVKVTAMFFPVSWILNSKFAPRVFGILAVLVVVLSWLTQRQIPYQAP